MVEGRVSHQNKRQIQKAALSNYNRYSVSVPESIDSDTNMYL